MSWTLNKIMKGARRLSASDIHLVRGVAPALRIDGEIRLLEGDALQEEDLRDVLGSVINDRQRQLLGDRLQLCFSGHWPEVGRFRASVYFRAGCPELAIRLCETTVRSREELNLPPVVDE